MPFVSRTASQMVERMPKPLEPVKPLEQMEYYPAQARFTWSLPALYSGTQACSQGHKVQLPGPNESSLMDLTSFRLGLYKCKYGHNRRRLGD